MNTETPEKSLYYETTTLCPQCEKLLPGRVQALENGIFITRTCPEHGYFQGLVCSDRKWYENLPRFDVKPIKPVHPQQPSDKGCPQDCGLCPAHRQIAGTAAIEISNRCNSQCPVCLADNRETFDLSVNEIRSLVENLMKRQGKIDVLTLSGGEPTIHPQFFDILKMLEPMDIGRIVVNSNGRRIAQDDRFVDELARHPRVYISLHFDGKRAKEIRGVDFSLQEKALSRLIERNISCVPLILGVKDINEDELGHLTANLLTHSDAVKTVMVSLMAYTGRGGSQFPTDPNRRLTIPAALDCMEQGSGGILKKQDFMPLPMPNPLCAAVGYFLADENRLTSLIPLAGEDKTIDFLANAHFGKPDEAFENFFREVIDTIYAEPNRFEDADRLLRVFKTLLNRLFPPNGYSDEDERRVIAEKQIKSVYLMQFMDTWTFDSVRMSKCSCQHLMPDGRSIPSCGYYSFHRKFDPRFAEVPHESQPVES